MIPFTEKLTIEFKVPDGLVSRLLRSYKDDEQNVNDEQFKTSNGWLPQTANTPNIGGIDYLGALFFPNYRNLSAITTDQNQLERVVQAVGSELVTRGTALENAAILEGRSKLTASNVEFAVKAIVTEFLDYIPELRLNLKEDVVAVLNKDPSIEGLYIVILNNNGYQSVETNRVAHFFYERELNGLARDMAEDAKNRFNFDIHPGTKLGKRIVFDHQGAVIGESAEIGEDSTLYQGVTLGAYAFQFEDRKVIRIDKRHPTIGNRNTVYSYAQILGGNVITGDDVIIGAETVILGGTKGVYIGNESKVLPGTHINGGPFKGDGYGVYIGSKVLIFPNAGIDGGHRGITVGDNSRIASGAQVLGRSSVRYGGRINIGNNSKVLPGVVLLHSIEPGTKYGGLTKYIHDFLAINFNGIIARHNHKG